MKFIYRRIGTFLVVLYIIGLLGLSYLLLNAKPRFWQLVAEESLIFGVLFSLLALALFSVLFSLLGTNVVVELKTQNLQDTKDPKDIEQKDEKDDINISTQDLSDLEAILREEQHNKRQLLDRFVSLTCKNIQAAIGGIYIAQKQDGHKKMHLVATYAYPPRRKEDAQFDIGEGLVGQVAKNGKFIKLNHIPDDEEYRIVSGLGETIPKVLALTPIRNEEEEVLGVIEVGFLHNINGRDESFLKEVASLLAREIQTNEYDNINF